MKCTIPEISWHNREPVLSVDIHPVSNNFYKVATGGGDCHVLIWQMTILENGAVKQDLLSDLTRHQRTVNVVRWSPNGQYLATADDDANIIIWQQKTDDIPLLDKESSGNEIWISYKVLRGHKEDIYDLCWSPNGQKLLTGSIDNTAIIWDFAKGKNDCILTEHKGFVQGVAWDPKGTYISTISTDRVLRIFDCAGKHAKARVSKGTLPVPKDHYLYEKEVKYFHDDTFKSFFRRLHFSPDGSLLVVPSGKVEEEGTKKSLYATFIFTVESWTMPVGMLPNPRQCSTVVRCCPILFELREDGPQPVFSLPYRIVIAVGTDRDIILYDTQQLAPFARFRDVHYTRLTDITWSSDGRLLVASSTDGFCSLVTFDPNEIGNHYVKEESEPEENSLDVSGCAELDVEDAKHKSIEISKPKKSKFLEEWAAKTPKKIKLDVETTDRKSTTVANTSLQMDVVDLTDDNSRENDTVKKDDINVEDPKPKPKRITPIPVISKDPPSSSSVNETKTICSSQPSGSIVKKRITPVPVKCDKTNDVKSKLVAQPIAVRRKPREIIQPSQTVDLAIKKTEETEPCTFKILNEDVKPPSETVLVPKLVFNDQESTSPLHKTGSISEKETLKDSPLQSVSSGSASKNNTPLKPDTTKRKSKQGSGKRSNQKTNSLLKFLKPSSKDNKKEKQSAKANLFGTAEDKDDDCIIIGDEARDAWKCNTVDSQSKVVSEKPTPMQVDDSTEDFCLQIEDSNSQKSDVAPCENNASSCDTIQMAEGGKAKNKENQDGKETVLHSESKEEETVTVTVQSNACRLEDSKNIHKINRVPLITLSSPKNKGKE